MMKTPYGHRVYAMAAEYHSAAGMFIRRSRFMGWTKRWGLANRG